MDNRSEFIKTIDADFKRWCNANEVKETNELLVKYLVDRNLIQEKTIKRFIVVKNYPEALANNFGIKKAAMWELEEKTGVNSSTIETWLGRYQTKFKCSCR